MLTDVFHDRYADRVIWTDHTPKDAQLNVKLYRIVEEQLFPPFDTKGASIASNVAHWKALDRKLSMELGMEHLSQTWFSTGTDVMSLSPHQICKNFMCAAFDPTKADPDEFMKQRVSFIELALREMAEANAYKESDEYKHLDALIAAVQPRGPRIPADPEAGRKARIAARDQNLQAVVDEVNARFAAARKPLNYHNGFVQISTDEMVEQSIEKPFWHLVADPNWINVDTDLKEAMDRRDTGGRDPALYAAKALESTIKILSDELNATQGTEKGAHNYIDNLISSRSGQFIEAWEGTQLKSYFTSVRNPLGHGPGNEPMPQLSPAQTDWAIEFVMIWIKSLIGRVQS
jgi:hypothetical protein